MENALEKLRKNEMQASFEQRVNHVFLGKPAMNDKQHLIDEKAALNALSGDRQLLGELAVMFVEDAPVLLQELETATDRQDFETARRTIHSLRGLSSTFYATEVTNLASRLEHDVKNADAESLNGGIDELRRSIESLMQELRDSGYTE